MLVLLAIVSAIGVFWAAVLYRRASDRSTRLLAVLLALMPLYQTMAVCLDTGVWNPSAPHLRVLAHLGVNIVFLLSIWILEAAINHHYRVATRLRLLGDPPLAPRGKGLAGFGLRLRISLPARRSQ
jgi:hypothetical protein